MDAGFTRGYNLGANAYKGQLLIVWAGICFFISRKEKQLNALLNNFNLEQREFYKKAAIAVFFKGRLFLERILRLWC